jgi:hypothetical protein
MVSTVMVIYSCNMLDDTYTETVVLYSREFYYSQGQGSQYCPLYNSCTCTDSVGPVLQHSRAGSAPNLTTMTCTLLITTLLATPLLVAAQGKGTECATLADFAVFKKLVEADGDKMKNLLQLSTTCLACTSGISDKTSVGTCFPAATKGKCTPGDVALGKAKAFNITSDVRSDLPKGLTAACIGCVMNGIIIPEDKCEGIGGTAASTKCASLPYDYTCIRCREAAHLAGYIACEGAPAPPAPPPASTSGAYTALPAALASIAAFAAVVCSI